MSKITPAEVREYLAGLARADDFEREELRKAPVDLKLRQLWALMSSAELFEDAAAREAGIRAVRERWARIYLALNA